jgi:hypothetical protein
MSVAFGEVGLETGLVLPAQIIFGAGDPIPHPLAQLDFGLR